jgi:hypothetical protein
MESRPRQNHRGEKQRVPNVGINPLDPKLEAIRSRLMERRSSVDWTETAKKLFLDGTKTKNYIGAAPILSLSNLKFPMIKKNNERLYTLARSRINAAIKEGRLVGLDPIMISEIARVSDQTHITH